MEESRPNGAITIMQTPSPRRTRPIHAALLTISLAACSGSSQTGTASRQPASDPAPPGTAGTVTAGITARAESAGAPTSNPTGPSSEVAAGPPPPSTMEIHGYFTNATTRNSLRLWKGPNDHPGFERLTRFTVEVDGVPHYSRAVSSIRLAGVCRSSGKGLDHLLFSFYPERRGGGAVGVLWYKTQEHRFMLGFAPKDVRVDCAGGRAILPEGAPALPCTCPWGDGPDDPSGAAAAAADTREILILPEAAGGPAFTRQEATSGADTPALPAGPGGS
jgi:hypothetical protein